MSKTSQRELSYFQLGQQDARAGFHWLRLTRKHRFFRQYQLGWSSINQYRRKKGKGVLSRFLKLFRRNKR